tara:strand:- start:548 stop:736 length:189 start_codon:yes stop_codon:yes gene_type:complete
MIKLKLNQIVRHPWHGLGIVTDVHPGPVCTVYLLSPPRSGLKLPRRSLMAMLRASELKVVGE